MAVIGQGVVAREVHVRRRRQINPPGQNEAGAATFSLGPTRALSSYLAVSPDFGLIFFSTARGLVIPPWCFFFFLVRLSCALSAPNFAPRPMCHL